MCYVCSLEQKNFGNATGVKGRITTRKMFRAYTNATAIVKLCYVHDIELHVTGEERFLRNHPLLAKDLARNSQKYMGSKKDDDVF